MNKNSEYGAEIKTEVTVKNSHDTFPSGLDRVLELLSNSIDVSDPSGSLEVSEREFRGVPGQIFQLTVTYKNPDGSFEPDKIYIDGMEGKVDGYCKVFRLPVVKGKTTVYIVRVSGTNKQIDVSTTDSSAR